MKSSDKKAKKPLKTVADDFLIDLLKASSPSGYESEVQAVIEKYVAPVAENFSKDVLGNRIATIHSQGCPHVLMTGHMDEIGFIVSHVNKEGFVFFDAIGGHDVGLISGRKVKILTTKGVVYGVTGRRAVHLLDAEERKKLPKLRAIWIDIGAKSREEALKKIAIGDPIVYEQEPFYVLNGCMCGRGIDDRGGTYVVQEVLRRLAKDHHLEASLTSVSTTQEEIGIRGAMPVTYAIHPDVGIAVDVGHATDFPDGESNRLGDFKLGAGPILARGPNISPIVFVKLKECAERLKIPYQVQAESGPTGTDARVIQMSRNGVATGLVSIPLRYMHTPNEMVCLDDIEWTIQLLVDFTRSLKASDKFEW